MAESPERGEGPPTRRPPGSFPRKVLVVLGLVSVVAGLWLLLWQAVYLLLVTFAGVLLAVLLRGLSDPLARITRMPPLVALTVTLVTLVAIIGGGGWLLAAPVAAQIEALGERIPAALEELLAEIEAHPWAQHMLPEEAALQDLWGEALTWAGGMVTSTAEGLVYLFVVLAVGVYGAYAPRLYRRGMLALVPPVERSRTRAVLDELASALRWWLMGRLFSMIVVAVLTGVGLWLLDVPLALALAILAGLLDFIPILGPFIAAFPAVLLALMEGPEKALWVVGLFVVVQQIESYLITPLVQQKAVDLPPVLTVLVQILMGAMAGFIGIMMATPLAAVGLVLVRRLYVEDTLGDRRVLDSPELLDEEG